jgi:hypothetical protein
MRRAFLYWGAEERCPRGVDGESWPDHGSSFFRRTQMDAILGECKANAKAGHNVGK